MASAKSSSFDRLATIIGKPQMLPWYLRWTMARTFKRPCKLKLSNGAVVSGFRAFSEFWAARSGLEENEIALLTRECRNAGTVIDIGANIGLVAAFIQQINPDARIYCFEPSPQTAAILRGNLKGAASVQPFAVADTEGVVRFLNNSHGSAVNRIVQRSDNSTIEVPKTTLDAFVEREQIQQIDFLKIDVEGAEVALLRGARRTLRAKQVRIGMIEVCPGNLANFGVSVRDLIAEAADSGYRLSTINPDGTAGPPVVPPLPESALINAILHPA